MFGVGDVHIALAITKYYGVNPHLLKYIFKLKYICPVPGVAFSFSLPFLGKEFFTFTQHPKGNFGVVIKFTSWKGREIHLEFLYEEDVKSPIQPTRLCNNLCVQYGSMYLLYSLGYNLMQIYLAQNALPLEVESSYGLDPVLLGHIPNCLCCFNVS